MAVNLERFLEEQLSQLSADDPDKGFLEKIQTQTMTYLRRNDLRPHHQGDIGGFLNYGEHIAQYFTTARIGPYLDIAELMNKLTSTPTHGTLVYGERLIHDIQQYGDDSTAHLLLPSRPWYHLRRNGLNSITRLRQSFKDLTMMRDCGQNAIRTVKEALETFDQLLAEHQAVEHSV